MVQSHFKFENHRGVINIGVYLEIILLSLLNIYKIK